MEEKKKYLTKDVLNAFIAKSAKEFNVSVATYLEHRAHNNYVVMEGTKPVCWENGDLMVLNTKALAKEEAKEYPKARVVTEYDYYVSKGLFNNVA